MPPRSGGGSSVSQTPDILLMKLMDDCFRLARDPTHISGSLNPQFLVAILGLPDILPVLVEGPALLSTKHKGQGLSLVSRILITG